MQIPCSAIVTKLLQTPLNLIVENVPILNRPFCERTTLVRVNYKPKSPLSLLRLFALEIKITVVHTVLIRRNSSILTYPGGIPLF